PFTGTVTLSYNNGASVQTVPRTLNGVASTPAVLTFGGPSPYPYNVVLNGFFADNTFTITNSGGVTATLMNGSGLSAPFTFAGGIYPGGGTCGATLAATASCTVGVRFAPTATNAFSSTATVGYNDGVAVQSATRNVNGNGYVMAATLALQTPATSPNNNATPTIRVSSVVSGVGVQLHSNASCTASKSTGTSVGTTIDLTSSSLTDATWNFYAKVTDSYGNGTCGAATVTYALDTTAPLAPSGWTLTSPANGAISNDNTPIINGTAIFGEDGSTAKLYSDASCTTNIDNAVISAGSFSMTAIAYATNGTADGAKQYYGRIVDIYGNQSGCTNVALGYTYDHTAPNPATAVVVASTWTSASATVTPLFSWTGTASPDLNRYEVGLDTAAAGGNSAGGWTSVGTSLSTTMSGLAALTQCTNYYPTVRAIDNAGNASTLAVGAPFKYDSTAPTQPGVIVLGTTMTKSQSPVATWTASTEACSFSHYDIALGSTSGGTDIVGWTNIGNVLTYQFTALTLTRGNSYFITLRGVDSAGNIGIVRTSAAFVPPLPTLDGAWEEFTTNGTHDNLATGVGKNRVLFVTIMTKDNASNNVTLVKYNNVAMTQASEVESTDGTNYYRTEVWYMTEATLATIGVANTLPFTYTTSNGAVTALWWVSAIYKFVNQATPVNATGAGIAQPAALTVSAALSSTTDNLNMACSIMGISNAGYAFTSANWLGQTLSNTGGGTATTRLCGYMISTATGTETPVATSPANGLQSMVSVSFKPEP
ncbi:MAG: hypothetical protein ACXVA9_04625, partial [Bdellovibrionales bacterium]